MRLPQTQSEYLGGFPKPGAKVQIVGLEKTHDGIVVSSSEDSIQIDDLYERRQGRKPLTLKFRRIDIRDIIV